MQVVCKYAWDVSASAPDGPGCPGMPGRVRTVFAPHGCPFRVSFPIVTKAFRGVPGQPGQLEDQPELPWLQAYSGALSEQCVLSGV